MKLKIVKSFSKKFSQEIHNPTKINNYYFNFHKEKTLNPASTSIINLFSQQTDDSNYHISTPWLHCEASFAETYVKQVMAIILNNKLLQSPKIMPEAKEKAKMFLKIKNFSVGAYSESKGLLEVRRSLQNWYFERDGYKIDEDLIYLTNGGNNCYEHAVSLIFNPGESILVPNPCYPIYLNFNKANNVENIFYNFENLTDKNLKINVNIFLIF